MKERLKDVKSEMELNENRREILCETLPLTIGCFAGSAVIALTQPPVIGLIILTCGATPLLNWIRKITKLNKEDDILEEEFCRLRQR